MVFSIEIELVCLVMVGNISGIMLCSLSWRCLVIVWMQLVMCFFFYWCRDLSFYSISCRIWWIWVGLSFLCLNSEVFSGILLLKKNLVSGVIWLKFFICFCMCGVIFIRYLGFNVYFCILWVNFFMDCLWIYCLFSQESFFRLKIGLFREMCDRLKCLIILVRVNFLCLFGIDQFICLRQLSSVCGRQFMCLQKVIEVGFLCLDSLFLFGLCSSGMQYSCGCFQLKYLQSLISLGVDGSYFLLCRMWVMFIRWLLIMLVRKQVGRLLVFISICMFM